MVSYKIVRDESKVYNVINGSTNDIVHHSLNGRAEVQWAFDHLTNGRTTKENVIVDSTASMVADKKLELPGLLSFTNNAQITIKSGITDITDHPILICTGDKINIFNGIYDGNCLEYNRKWGSRDESPHGTHGINTGGHNNIEISNVRVQNTIRSNVVLGGFNNKISNSICHNSLTDHWIYITSSTYPVVSKNKFSGYCAFEGVTVRNTIGGLIQQNTIENINCNPNKYGLGHVVRFREGATHNSFESNVVNLGDIPKFDWLCTFRKESSSEPMSSNNKFINNKVYGGLLDDYVVEVLQPNSIVKGNLIQNRFKNYICGYDETCTISDNTGFELKHVCGSNIKGLCIDRQTPLPL